MLTISGVSAEEIDVDSSVVAESPISAELDNSLSSYDASSDDLSAYESYDMSDCEGFHHSSESLDSSDAGSFEYSDSYDSVSYEPSDSFESCDVYFSCGYIDSYDCQDSQIPCDSLDFDDYEVAEPFDSIVCDSFVSQNDDARLVGDVSAILGVADESVVENDYNYYCDDDNFVVLSTDRLNTISNFNSLTRYDELRIDNLNSGMSGVTSDMEASKSNNFSIDVNPQVNNLLRFESDCDVLDIYALDLQEISETSEPVFDCILVTSGYVSDEEAYFGTISDSDREMLLKYIGADNLILFAISANEWNSGVAFDILKNVTLNQQIDEINLVGYKIAKALLKYYPSTNEIFVGLSDNEDEHGHVINDTNSHGLDYAYIKHVNVIYKDMPNLKVLTSSDDGSNEQASEGFWDGLNDVLGASASSETLLPDHKAIWAPLLLLIQQDLQESNVKSHADDNRNKKLNKTKTNDTDKNNTNSSNMTPKGWIHDYDNWQRNHNGYNNYDGHDYYGYEQVCYAYQPDDGLKNGKGNVTDLNKKKHDNSTDDKNKSSNATSTVNKAKSSGSPKAPQKGGEPTYTLVYAIIGIAIVGVLFNSGYMKRND